MNKILFCTALFSTIFFSIEGFSTSFITTWKTDNPGTSNSTSITIPTFNGEAYNYDVDWDDDGTFDEFGLTGNVTHDFGVAGTYTIRIQGTFPRIYFFYYGDRLKLLSIDQWGNNVWTSMVHAFYGAENMTSNALDVPDLSMVTGMHSMFRKTHFNGDVSNWDVSNVTDMSWMFAYTTGFNGDVSNWDVSAVTDMHNMFVVSDLFDGDVSNWDVSNVTNMEAMFNYAISFNGDVSNWDVSNITNMSQMFSNAYLFNGDVSNWDVSNVTFFDEMFFSADAFNGDVSNWDVSNAISMYAMFRYAISFNSDISAWDVSNVSEMRRMFEFASIFNCQLNSWDMSGITDMRWMFNGATSFNQNLGSWDISAQPNMNDMLDNSGLSAENYDNTLIGWESQGVSNLTLGANSLSYCNSQTERSSLINTYGWTISGDMLDCGPLPVEILEFEAIPCRDKTLLEWSTASETNNQGFEIQRSHDGRSWEKLAFVSGQGAINAIQKYTYTDTNPFYDINYYRLKQIDLDGSFEFSEMISVHFQNALNTIEVFPNPTKGVLTILSDEVINVNLYNALGELISNYKMNEVHQIDISKFPDGIYYVEMQRGNKLVVRRILKNR